MGGSSMSVGKFQFTGKTWLIIGVVAAVIIGVAFLATQGAPSTRSVKESQQITVQVKNNIGIDRLTITNLNTGQIYKATLIDLPFSFNCTRGDYLRFEVKTLSGYEWNAFWFNSMGRYDNSNPLTLDSNDDRYCVNNQIIITPKCIILSPTVTPTPQPTTAPTATPFNQPLSAVVTLEYR
jgi:hypothetical protein